MKNVLSILILGFLFSGCCSMTSPRESTYYSGEQQPFMQPTPDLDANIVACSTHLGLDGETTTVWVTIVNSGGGAADDVSVKFEANDGDYSTPPQSDLGRIPAQRKVTISRTVDTRFGTQTDIRVTVTALDTYPIIRDSADCRQLDSATIQNLNTLVSSGLIPI